MATPERCAPWHDLPGNLQRNFVKIGKTRGLHRSKVSTPGIIARVKAQAMPSTTYHQIAEAMRKRRQVVCVYDGYRREFCPIILGHRNGEEVALVYQFAGASKSGLPADGQWKCLRLVKMKDVQLRAGRWYAGPQHRRAQSCVEDVDLDVNPASPYRPKPPA